MRPSLQNFDHNDCVMAGNKNILLFDLENLGQGHHLQKLLYLSYYRTNFYQTFIEIMAM